jgi:hypothetical protein
VNIGDVLYLVDAIDTETVPNLTKTFVLGNHRIFAVEVSPETGRILRQLFPEIGDLPASFSVSVVLPSWIDPRSVGPIGGPPEESVLICIHPPRGLTPQFEVVEVPMVSDRIETIAVAKEKGASVFYWTKFPGRGSRRISIHWGGSHRLVHLYASPDSGPRQPLPELPLGISVRTKEGNEEFLTPWLTNPETCSELSCECQPNVVLEGPPEMSVELTGEKADGEVLSHANENNVNQSNINSILESWTTEGYLNVRVDFGPMGAVAILYSREGPKPMTIEEIERRIEELDPLPRKVTWQLLREIGGVPTGTPHHAVKQVRLSQIRIALKKVRKAHEE